ncbi:MAG: DUF6491 family protein [Proteobacteria bacterium]|nr:DUF6491 family protein [Pseudomonadota bacterium]
MIKKSIVMLLLVGSLVACAPSNKASHKTSTKDNKHRFQMYDDYIVSQALKPVKTIRRFKFLNWKSLDNRHLIVSSSRSNQYLVTLNNYCIDLDVAHAIVFDQTMSNSLSAKFDSIIVAGQSHQKCRISTIHPLNDEQEKEVMNLRRNNK